MAEKSATPNASTDSMQENVQKLGELIKGIKIAMLTTVDPDGVLRSRPMATQETDFDGTLWFFTGSHSGKVASIENDQHVNLAYASPDDNRYVSISGHARLVLDKDKMAELWNPILKAWFPEGLEDPEIGLIRVDAETAEYWDSPSSKFVQLVGFTKAIATGKPYNAEEHHGQIDLNPSTH